MSGSSGGEARSKQGQTERGTRDRGTALSAALVGYGPIAMTVQSTVTVEFGAIAQLSTTQGLASCQSRCTTHCTRRIMDSLTEQQLDRYESFRRSSLARPKVKKVGIFKTDARFVSAACS